jgi:hypothetical protein
VQAAEQLDAEDAEEPGARVEHVQPHAGRGEPGDVPVGQVGRSVAVHRQVDAHAALRGLDQHVAQLVPHLVVEQDEGLDEDFAPRLSDRVEHGREEFFAVLQQPEPVAGNPALLVAPHIAISTASGAWSDRCDHGRLLSTRGRCGCAWRT